MDPEREKLIRHTWDRTRATMVFQAGFVLCARADLLDRPKVMLHRVPTRPDPIEILDYRCEFYGREGRKAYRVVCEGIVVEDGWR
ncbi:hypothetical protein [Stappia indica]|uniref:hypothetical protein n=1 Tax=Stappia indica TaxID=538381 RepID=UPI001D183287|nr:hypothetical protein [Stappia indica]MCC4243388.1 hypothetical protein [Stappia indica]